MGVTEMKQSEESRGRLLSLDALRGFDMLFIMGLTSVVVGLCNALGFGDGCWLASQMRHVKWHGFAHHDTIFPLFLFIAGVAFPFSCAKMREKGWSVSRICGKIAWRAFALVMLGMVYNGLFNKGFGDVRWASVLGRIGLAWAGAGLLYVFCGVRTRLAVSVTILVGYGLSLALFTAPDAPPGADPFSMQWCIVGWIDRHLLPGRLYLNTFDPEGLCSTLPAIVTAMLGMFCGDLLRSSRPSLTGGRKVVLMLAVAVSFAIVAALFAPLCPINKNLWTPTFVLAAGAYSVAMLALFYWIIDVKEWRGWSFPLRVVGMNAITVYLLQRIVDFDAVSKFFVGGVAGLLPSA